MVVSTPHKTALHRGAHLSHGQTLRKWWDEGHWQFPLYLTAVALIAAFVVLRPLRAPSPIAYANAGTPVMPDSSLYCPGDTVTFTPTLTLSGEPMTPIRIEALRSWFDLDRHNGALLANGKPAPTIEARRNSLPGTYTPAITVTVPLFNPGHYALLSTTVGASTADAGYLVPVTVGKCGASQ